MVRGLGIFFEILEVLAKEKVGFQPAADDRQWPTPRQQSLWSLQQYNVFNLSLHSNRNLEKHSHFERNRLQMFQNSNIFFLDISFLQIYQY